MLPEWVYAVAALIGIIVPLISFLGWLLSRVVPRVPPRRRRAAPRGSRNDALPRDRTSIGSHIRAAISNMIVRPDVPIEEDIKLVILGVSCLLAATIFFAWSWVIGPDWKLFQLMHYLLLVAMLFLALCLVYLTARLFWKFSYLRTENDGNGGDAPPAD